MPTAMQRAMARSIHSQGMMKEACMTAAMMLPMRMPATMPIRPPVWPMITDSIRNCALMRFEAAPRALRVPISRVRSRTDTSMMFIRPTAAPVRVTRPMTMAAIVRVRIVELSSSMTASLRVMRKSASSKGASRLTARKVISASVAAASGLTEGSGRMPIVKSGVEVARLARALV